MLAEHHFPVVETHRDQHAVIVEVVELVAIALGLFAGQVRQLVETVQVHLEVAAAGHRGPALEQLVLDVGIASHCEQGGEPVQPGEHFVADFTCLDFTRPAHDRRDPEGTFPVGVLLVAERRGCRVRPGELVGPVVGGVDHDGVVGELQVVEGFQQFADVAVMLKHAIGVLVAGHTTLALHRVAHVGKDVHARGVHPHKKRLVGLGLLFDKCLRRRGGFIVDGFHALGGQGPGVFNLAVGKTVNHPSGRGGLDEGRVILGPVRALGLFFGIEVVEVAEELVKTMIGRQVFVAVAQVVFTELCRGVALRLERLGDGDIALLQAHRCPRDADLGQAGAQRRLPGNE